MLFYIYLFILGSAIGSFLNVVIDRLPQGKSLTGRSVCDYCGRKLGIKELIPIYSYFFLKGKTACCNKPISFYYPLVEFISAVSLPLTFWYFSHLGLIKKIFLSLIVFSAIVIFFSDLKYMVIPDEVQVFLLIVSYFYNFNCSGNFLLCGSKLFISSLFKGVLVALPIASIFYITQGRGIGFADVKLALNIGFLYGLKIGLLVLYLAFMLGGFVAILLVLSKKKRLKSKVPFGPFLVISMVLFLVIPHKITEVLKLFFSYFSFFV